jgi:hypothetical protein
MERLASTSDTKNFRNLLAIKRPVYQIEASAKTAEAKQQHEQRKIQSEPLIGFVAQPPADAD